MEPDFVEPLTMDDESALAAELDESFRHDPGHRRLVDSEKLPVREGGIGERPEKIEERSDPERSSHRSDVRHRGMEDGSEEKGETRRVETARRFRRAEAQNRSGRLEDVGASRLGGHAPVTVLRDRPSRGRHHESGGGRDVEGPRPVAPRAAGVEKGPHLGRDRDAMGSHRAGAGREGARVRLAHAEGDEKSGGDGLGHLAQHDPVKGVLEGLGVGGLAPQQFFDQFGNHGSRETLSVAASRGASQNAKEATPAGRLFIDSKRK